MLHLQKIEKFLKISMNGLFFKALLNHRVAAGVEHCRILQSLKNKNFQTVVDIGANRGQFALAARMIFPNARIISFEPLREPAAIFRGLFQSDPKVVLHESAIGPDEREMTIHVSSQDDSSSLYPITSLQNHLFPGTEEKEIRKVQVKPLNALISAEEIGSSALLKIDVQGFEKEALDGCKSLLSVFSNIYVECSFIELYAGQSFAHEVISFLEEQGFVLSGVYHLCYDRQGIALQGDFLFNRKISNDSN